MGGAGGRLGANVLNFGLFSAPRGVKFEMATHGQSGKRSATIISSLAKSFIESEKNSNAIVDILEYFQVGWKQFSKSDMQSIIIVLSPLD